jgi:hypothetical protein
MTGHLTETRRLRRLDGVIGDAGLRAAIGYWDSLRGARVLPSRMDLDPTALRPHLQEPQSWSARAPAACASGWAARGSTRFGHGCAGPAAPGAVRPVRTRAGLGRMSRPRWPNAALMILDVMSPAPRFGRPEAEGLRAQIAVLPMTDADLAPTRALYVMGAVEGRVRKADAPHRWCATNMRKLQLRAGEPVLSDPPALRRPRAVTTPPARDEAATEARGPVGPRAVSGDRRRPQLARRAQRLAAGRQFLGHEERQLQRLRGIQARIAGGVIARDRSSSVSARMPPVHSVTSLPVISKCTPPGTVPSARWMAKNSCTSRRIASKGRVL